MLSKEWSAIDGITDSENNCYTVCAKTDDAGLALGYMNCGEVNIVTLSGVFDVSTMHAAGKTAEEVQNELNPGEVAVPVMISGDTYVVVIGSDFDLRFLGVNASVYTYGIDVDNVEECVPTEEADEDLCEALGVM